VGTVEKKFARDLYDILISLPKDTTPERIKANRDRLRLFMGEGTNLKDLGCKHEALDLLYEWFHYFDGATYKDGVRIKDGYKSKYNIDDLPQLLEEKLIDMAVKG